MRLRRYLGTALILLLCVGCGGGGGGLGGISIPDITQIGSAPPPVAPTNSASLPSLAFAQPPATTDAGSVLPTVEVELRDAGGQPVAASGVSVTVALDANPGGAVLRGTTTELTVNGVASFSDLAVSTYGQGYTLDATSPGFNEAVSGAFIARATFTEFDVAAGAAPTTITSGPDGRLWFTENSPSANGLGRVTTGGLVAEFNTGVRANSGPQGIASGPDGALWFTEARGNQIGRMTTDGTLTNEFSTGISAAAGLLCIVSGTDGNLWFTENARQKIGRITPTGTVSEFSTLANSPRGIVYDPNDAFWFTLDGAGEVARISPLGSEDVFTLSLPAGGGTAGITVGPDGAIWYTEPQSEAIGRTAATPVPHPSTSFALPSGVHPESITTGSDGNLWFTDPGDNLVGRLTTTGVVTEFPAPTPNSGLSSITSGPDGDLWFTESTANRVGRLTP